MTRQKKDKEKDSKDRLQMHFDISQETINSIWGVLSFIGAFLSILAFVGKAGPAGQVLDTASRSFFGWGFFILPIALFLLGVAFIRSISRRIYASAVLGTVVFTLSFLGVFYVLGNGQYTDRLLQGGYVGIVFGYPLLRFTGFAASMLILVSMMFVAILLALNIPLYRLIEREDKEQKESVPDKLVIKKGNETFNPDDEKKSLQKPLRPAQGIAAKTEVTDKEFVIKNLKSGKWTLPPLELLHEDQDQAVTGDINASATIIRRTLSNFGIDVEMGEVSIGPTVTQFTMRPAVGVKLSRITALNSDLSLALAAHPIRIEAPIPGKSLVGVEVPNQKVALIGLRNMFELDEFKKSKYFLPLALGRDVAGNAIFAGLDKMPHLLIAGATGSGKSAAINALLLSMLYKHSPHVLKLMLVDPKRVELTLYNDIPHLITPVITDNKKVLGALKWAVGEMDRRYDQLSKMGARDIFSYNAKMTEKNESIMPAIVIVIDELADLMASFGRDVEAAIVRLAQMSRAVGIHLIISTQRPSVEVITGLIKANITSRMAMAVASQVDSRTILDMAGAEKLLGKGDMLFLSGDTAKPRRLQSAFASEKEVKDVVKFIKEQSEGLHEPDDSLQVDFNAPVHNTADRGDSDVDDDMYEDAKQVVIEAGKASASLLQRRLRVGYARAARLLDILEEKGIIGPGDGAKPREVYVKPEGVQLSEDAVLAGESGIHADSPEAETNEV